MMELWANAEHVFFVVISLWLLGLTIAWWRHRVALRECQRDVARHYDEVVEFLTKPEPPKPTRHITCNQCLTVMTPEAFAHHRCVRLKEPVSP